MSEVHSAMSNPWAEVPPGSAPEPKGPFAPVTLEALQYLARNMRPVDQEEIYNWVGFHDEPDALAQYLYDMIQARGRARIVMYDGKPAAWIGVVEDELGSGIWTVTMGGTVYLTMVAYHCMAWARWTTRETAHNGIKLYCDSREGHSEAHKMLLALGARVESEVRIGHDGGKYYRFYWLYGANDVGVSQPGKPNHAATQESLKSVA